MTNPTTPVVPPVVNVGTFVTTSVLGYVEPSLEEAIKIEQMVRALNSSSVSPDFLNGLFMIKLLAPDAARELKIYNIDAVVAIVGRLKGSLVRSYYAKA